MTDTLISMIGMMKYRYPPENVITAINAQIDYVCSKSSIDMQRRVIEALVLILDDGKAPEPSRIQALNMLTSIGMKDNDAGALDILTLWEQTPVSPTDELTKRVHQACERLRSRWAEGTE
jgi:hypothetical protein